MLSQKRSWTLFISEMALNAQGRVPEESCRTFLTRAIVRQADLIGKLEMRVQCMDAEVINLRFRIQILEQHLGLYFVFPSPVYTEAHLPAVPLSPRQPSE